ncbi:uncharacterized protein LOC141850618 [Brevipalpus obovatus]|uniref:uncharacterized protein LOC141850618 n=1 Tax=Brevipalpus obovatus TaxID=246614 RepID=UPI003D9F8AE3
MARKASNVLLFCVIFTSFVVKIHSVAIYLPRQKVLPVFVPIPEQEKSESKTIKLFDLSKLTGRTKKSSQSPKSSLNGISATMTGAWTNLFGGSFFDSSDTSSSASSTESSLSLNQPFSLPLQPLDILSLATLIAANSNNNLDSSGASSITASGKTLTTSDSSDSRDNLASGLLGALVEQSSGSGKLSLEDVTAFLPQLSSSTTAGTESEKMKELPLSQTSLLSNADLHTLALNNNGDTSDHPSIQPSTTSIGSELSDKKLPGFKDNYTFSKLSSVLPFEMLKIYPFVEVGEEFDPNGLPAFKISSPNDLDDQEPETEEESEEKRPQTETITLTSVGGLQGSTGADGILVPKPKTAKKKSAFRSTPKIRGMDKYKPMEHEDGDDDEDDK